MDKNNNIDKIEIVRKNMPSTEKSNDLADLFKVFGDATRTKILSCLSVQSLYVCDIANILNMTISAVSHQLRVLRSAKLVRGEKQGKEVLYSLDDDHVTKILECGLSHINEGNFSNKFKN